MVRSYESDQELERLRRRARWSKNTCVAIALLSFWPFLAGIDWIMKERESQIAMRVAQDLVVAAVLALIVFCLLWSLLGMKLYQRFNEEFKRRYAIPWISGIPGIQELYYDMGRGMSHREIRNAAVVGCGNEEEFTSSDLLAGLYGGIPFRMSNVTTRRMVHSTKGRRRTEMIFTGQVLQFCQVPGERVSQGHLQIFQKELLSDFRGWKAEHPIKINQGIFEKKFQVYATNEASAWRILTPQLLERLTAFADASGKQVAVTFRDRDVFVAVYQTRNVFDGDLHMPVEEQKGQILEDMELLQKAWRFFLTT